MRDQKKSRVTVDIYNHRYTIRGDEDENHVRLVASYVDQKMREIHAANEFLDTRELAVLTAINAMNDFLKLKEENTSLKRTIKRLKEEK